MFKTTFLGLAAAATMMFSVGTMSAPAVAGHRPHFNIHIDIGHLGHFHRHCHVVKVRRHGHWVWVKSCHSHGHRHGHH